MYRQLEAHALGDWMDSFGNGLDLALVEWWYSFWWIVIFFLIPHPSPFSDLFLYHFFFFFNVM